MRLAVLLLLLSAGPAVAQRADPTPHRLLLMPTARPLPVGQGAVALTEVVVPNGAVGLGRGVTVALGVLGPGFDDDTGSVLASASVAVVDRLGLAVAVGVVGTADPLDTSEVAALPYAVVTVGTARRSLTVLVGGRVDARDRYTFDTGAEPFPRATPAGYRARVVPLPWLAVGGLTQPWDRLALVAEAMAVPYDDLYGDGVEGVLPDQAPPRYHLTGHAGARVFAGAVALDLGVLSGRDSAPRADPYVGPWLGVTVGVGG